MTIKQIKKDKSQYILVLIIGLFTLINLMPILWLVSASFQGPGEIFKVPFAWIPDTFTLENFKAAWHIGNIGEAFIASLKVVAIYVPCHLFVSLITGFVFAKYDFPFKAILFTLIIATMMIPQEVTYIPVYEVIQSMHLLDKPLGIVLPFVYSGFGVFFMYQFAQYVPDEILESARIDGCNNIRTFFFIVIPLMKSAIAALSILAFSFMWDEFAWSRLVVISKEARTLPLVLTHLSQASDNSTSFPALIGGSLLAMMPVMIIFFIFQKQFIESVANSGVKG